jgi:uncharacterized protein DUF4124
MIKIMRAPFLFLAAPILFLAPLAAAPAWADTIYKWVDEDGVMHYSNSRPADPSRKPEVLAEDKVSTYQTNPAELRAQAEAAARIRADNLARRVDYLERELAAQRQTQYAYAPEAEQPYDSYYGGPMVVYGAPVVPPRRLRPSRFQPINSITGLTAGNVVTFRNTAGPRGGVRAARSR